MGQQAHKLCLLSTAAAPNFSPESHKAATGSQLHYGQSSSSARPKLSRRAMPYMYCWHCFLNFIRGGSCSGQGGCQSATELPISQLEARGKGGGSAANRDVASQVDGASAKRD